VFGLYPSVYDLPLTIKFPKPPSRVLILNLILLLVTCGEHVLGVGAKCRGEEHLFSFPCKVQGEEHFFPSFPPLLFTEVFMVSFNYERTSLQLPCLAELCFSFCLMVRSVV
jgi:hypothetical protein